MISSLHLPIIVNLNYLIHTSKMVLIDGAAFIGFTVPRADNPTYLLVMGHKSS